MTTLAELASKINDLFGYSPTQSQLLADPDLISIAIEALKGGAMTLDEVAAGLNTLLGTTYTPTYLRTRPDLIRLGLSLFGGNEGGGVTITSETFTDVDQGDIVELDCTAILAVYEVVKVAAGTRVNPIMTGQYDQPPYYADANGNDGDNAPWKAFDGDDSTSWVMYDSGNQLIFDFGAATTFGGCRISLNSEQIDAGDAPKDFTAEYGSDGASWSTALAIANVDGWVGGVYKDFVFAANHTSRYFRLDISKTSGHWTAISSLEILDSNAFTPSYEKVNLSIVKDGTAHSIEKTTYGVNDLYVQYL